MNFIAKIVPVLILLGLIVIHPLVAFVIVIIYVGWKWAELGDKAHIGALAKGAGSDMGWAHGSAEENLSDGLTALSVANAEGKLAFANSDLEYEKGYASKYNEVKDDYAATRKEWRTKSETDLKSALAALNS